MSTKPAESSAKRRVFIMGAGVSAPCGIPVAKDILRESLLGLISRDRSSADVIHALLKYLYANFDVQLRNYPNIEDFLNLVEMAREFNREEFIESTLWPVAKLNHVYQLTLRAVTDLIWSRMQAEHSFGVVRDFVSYVVRDGDAIITFNWDTALERAICDDARGLEISYRYSRKQSTSTVFLLKPHGSIDWFLRGDLPRGIPDDDIFDVSPRVCAYGRFDFSRYPNLKGCKPLIVPPVSTKKFAERLWRTTWNGVYNAVSDATHLNVIGYSLPKEDQFARMVIRRAVRNNIIRADKGRKRRLKVVVVNPDETAETTFSRVLGTRSIEFSFRQSYFQDFVAAVKD